MGQTHRHWNMSQILGLGHAWTFGQMHLHLMGSQTWLFWHFSSLPHTHAHRSWSHTFGGQHTRGLQPHSHVSSSISWLSGQSIHSRHWHWHTSVLQNFFGGQLPGAPHAPADGLVPDAGARTRLGGHRADALALGDPQYFG